MPGTSPRTSSVSKDPADLDAAVAGIGLESAYQPIVSLPDEIVVGFEALARWPQLSNPNPRAVFDRAATTGDLDRLDRLCITSAIDGAVNDGLPHGTLLLVNSEPSSAYVGRADDACIARGYDELQLMFELTEHSLLAHPHTLLLKVAALRNDGFAIALDDVGAQPDSLALLDVVCPDIIKLDLALVQSQPKTEQARTMAAVLAHHERTGALILAEGIETDEHLEQALAMGAALGQGFRFGRAGPLDGQKPVSWSAPTRDGDARLVVKSPFELVKRRSTVRTARKSTLNAFTRHIENQAHMSIDPPMVLTALQKADYFVDETRDQYRSIAENSPLVAIFGRELPIDLGGRVRGVPLDPDDPLCAEWTVVVLGPHSAVALLGRETEDSHDGCEADRRFDFVITFDRSLVTVAARSLLYRML